MGTSRAIALKTGKGSRALRALEAEGANTRPSEDSADPTDLPSREWKKNPTIWRTRMGAKGFITTTNRQMGTPKTSTATRTMTMSTRNGHNPSERWNYVDLTATRPLAATAMRIRPQATCTNYPRTASKPEHPNLPFFLSTTLKSPT